MSPLHDLILQRKGELQTETVQMPPRLGAWVVSAIPTASVALFVGMALEMMGLMALQLSHSSAAR